MPAVILSSVNFENNRYYIDLSELVNVFPQIIEDKNGRLYLIEVRNERDKLVKRFKPFKELELKTATYWYEPTKKWIPCFELPEDVVSRFNIGKSYRVATILISYDGRPLLPLEIKCVGYGSERVPEYFSKIEADLISLSLEQPTLNKAISYLWDAYFRLEENDVEGARTSVRNSLDVLRKELVPKIKVIEELEFFPQRVSGLIKELTEFVHYGGPHPGPAPRTTTEMIISVTTELIRYFAKAFENKVISFEEGS